MAARIKVESTPFAPEDPTDLYNATIDDPMQVESGSDTSDPVVQEINVYLSPDLCKQLHLLQFPLQQLSTKHVYQPSAVRVKPRHGMIEIDQPLPSNNAIEQQGKYGLRTRTYASCTIPIKTHMCLGRLVTTGADVAPDHVSSNITATNTADTDRTDRTELHLIPLSHIAQMRPTFAHVDEAAVDNPTSIIEEELAAAAAAKAMQEKKPLTFQRKESERAAMARKSSYAYKKSSEEEEEWINLRVNNRTSDDVDTTMEGVVVPSSNIPNQYDNLMQKSLCRVKNNLITGIKSGDTAGISNRDYILSLDYTSPVTNSFDQQQQQQSSTQRNSSTLDAPSIVRQLTLMMRQGTLMPFAVLRGRFDAKQVTDQQLLQGLAVVSVAVRGNFCLRSQFINLPKGTSRVRNFLLLLLHTKGIVHRAPLQETFAKDHRVTPDRIGVILKLVGKQLDDGWTGLIDPDTTFQARYPVQYQVYEEYWATMSEQYASLLQRYDELLLQTREETKGLRIKSPI